MSTITVETEVDIDVDSFVSEIASADLIEELQKRGVDNYSEQDQRQLFEELYYALRDGNIDIAIAVINPLLEDVTGRRV